MKTRQHNTEIWEEEWFQDLPLDHKLFYLYAKDQANQAGFWRPKTKQFCAFQLNGKRIFLDTFLEQVNKPQPDEEPGKSTRIRVLDNGNWFFVGRIVEEMGRLFRPTIGAHRGILKNLIDNGIHPSEISGVNWLDLDLLDFQQLNSLVYGKSLYRETIDNILANHGLIERERKRELEIERDSFKNKKGITGNSGENGPPGSDDGLPPISPPPDEILAFPLQKLYDQSWDDLVRIKANRNLTIEGFSAWKDFVDLIINKNWGTEFFKLEKFINPVDFQKLLEEKNFTRDKWEPVLSKILSSGLDYKKHNLFYRIPQFITYLSNGNNNGFSPPTSSLHAGKKDYSRQKSW